MKGGRRQCTGSQSVMGRGAGEDFKGQEEQGLDPQVQERGQGGNLQVQESGEGGREEKRSDEKRVMGPAGEKGELQENKDKDSEEKETTMDQGIDSAAAYKEGYMDTVGRVLLATRPLSVGEVVVEDLALVAAPDGAPVCLGCLAMLTQCTPVNCVNCGWPLCRLEAFMGAISVTQQGHLGMWVAPKYNCRILSHRVVASFCHWSIKL